MGPLAYPDGVRDRLVDEAAVKNADPGTRLHRLPSAVAGISDGPAGFQRDDASMSGTVELADARQ